MPRLVFFDEAATPQHVTQVTGISTNEGLFIGRTDVVVSPDLSLLATEDAEHRLTDIVPRKYWKHQAGGIVTFTAAEIAAKDAADAADVAAAAAQQILDDRVSAKTILLEAGNLGVLIRALADVIRDEINILRGQHALPDRTLVQLRNAINARIDTGSVDT